MEYSKPSSGTFLVQEKILKLKITGRVMDTKYIADPIRNLRDIQKLFGIRVQNQRISCIRQPEIENFSVPVIGICLNSALLYGHMIGILIHVYRHVHSFYYTKS